MNPKHCFTKSPEGKKAYKNICSFNMLVESQDDPKTLRYQVLLYLHTLYLSTLCDINNMEIETLRLFHLIMSFEILPLVEGICHAMKKFTEETRPDYWQY